MGFEKKPKEHNQFAPIEHPYLKLWRDSLDGKELLQGKRDSDKTLSEVVEEIRKPLKTRTRKGRAKPRGRGLSDGQKEE
jgi:hypothetical protein